MAKNNDDREVYEVALQISQLLQAGVGAKLMHSISFWAPEEQMKNLRTFIFERVIPDSSNLTTIKIYAILFNATEESIKQYFIKEGF